MSRSEAEDGALGSMFFENELADDPRITDALFSNPEALKVLRTIRLLREEKKPVTLLTVKEAGREDLDIRYLASLTDHAHAANFDWYVNSLREALRKRTIRSITMRAQNDLEQKEESEKILADMETGILSLKTETCDLVEVVPEDALHEIITKAEKRMLEESPGPTGVVTGFPSLDMVTGGFQPGDFWVLAARTSVGKTALALSMTDGQIKENIPVGFATLEMSGRQIYGRLLAARSRVSSHKLRFGKLTPEDFSSIMVSAGPLSYDPLMVLDRPGLDARGFTSWARAAVGKGAKILYLDYVGLVKTDGDKPRWERMAEVSASLKQTARELKVPVVALAQLNRTAVEDGVPGLHQLRDSGSLEQDTDGVMLLYRPEEKAEDGETVPGTLYVAKQREGPTAKIKLDFHRPTCTFREAK